MESWTNLLKRISALPGLAEAVALIGAFVFFIQASHFARIQETILDEGTYLVKGFLFVSGRYSPFQIDGPHTNQMPLSFLIPGAIQVLFENSLRTGRYFSIFLGLLILLGLWIVARRLGNRWWAAGAVWMVAINPAYANGYSMAVSQVLVACMLTWVLVLALDQKAAIWRLALASVLASLMILTRVNMAPILPLLILFIFWQFGTRAGFWTLLVSGFTLLIGHLIYWPEILQIWANQIPGSIFSFLDPWRFGGIGEPIWNPNPGWQERIDGLLEGIRFNFLALALLSVSGILIVHKKGWKDLFYYRSTVFLVILSGILFAAHAWAALLKDYCVYCFAGYLEFFSPVLILLLILVFVAYRPGPARWYSLYVLAVILILSTIIGYAAAKSLGPALQDLPIPRLLTGRLGGGSIPLWGLLENGLGISYRTSRWLLPTLAGLLFGSVLILLGWLIYRSSRSRQAPGEGWLQPGLILVMVLLIAGALLSPTPVLASTASTYACQADMLSAMDEVGEHLQRYILPEKSVYWQGSLSAVPLLYIPDAQIYPAQLNDGYTFRMGGDTYRIRKFGLWNEELRDQWLDEADYIIIQEQYYDPEWKQFLESGDFDELLKSPAVNPCARDSALRIFRRKATVTNPALIQSVNFRRDPNLLKLETAQ